MSKIRLSSALSSFVFNKLQTTSIRNASSSSSSSMSPTTMGISKRIQTVVNGPYSLRSTLAKLQAVATEDTISFGLGAPDLQPPPEAIDACTEAMKNGFNSYTPIPGLPVLRERIAQLWRHLEPSLSVEDVCVTMSGTNALMNVLLTLINQEDSILLPDPYFAPYGGYVGLTGSENIVHYPCKFENNFVPDVADLEALIRPNTKAILYNFPSNPTGGVINAIQRDALMEFAKKHNIWIISDEVYDSFVYDGEAHVSFLGSGYNKVVMINSFSKTYAMPGWRLGYILSPNTVFMEYVYKTQEYLVTCSNEPMQRGILAALEKTPDYPKMMASIFQKRRDVICERLNCMPGVTCHVPKGSFYVFPKVDIPGMSSLEMAVELMRGGVLCSPGSVFGKFGEGHLRFTFTLHSSNIQRGMDRMEGVVKGLLQSHHAFDRLKLEQETTLFM